MSELDAAVQIVKIEVEGMTCCLKMAGQTAAKAAQAFLKLIKALGNGAHELSMRKKMSVLEKSAGIVDMKIFKEKYAGDNMSLISLKDTDVDMFADMCGKEGIAIVKLPDFNEKDGYTQFMIAGSTAQTVRFNFDKINDWHISNGTFTENCGNEISAEEYVLTAPGDTPEEKIENFSKSVEEKFPGADRDSIKKLDLSSRDEILQFIQNAATDEKSMLMERIGYEKIPLDNSRIVGEDEKQVSLLTVSGENINIDKPLVVTEKGKFGKGTVTYAYCPTDAKSDFGSVYSGGKKLDMNEFKSMIYPAAYGSGNMVGMSKGVSLSEGARKAVSK